MHERGNQLRGQARGILAQSLGEGAFFLRYSASRGLFVTDALGLEGLPGGGRADARGHFLHLGYRLEDEGKLTFLCPPREAYDGILDGALPPPGQWHPVYYKEQAIVGRLLRIQATAISPRGEALIWRAWRALGAKEAQAKAYMGGLGPLAGALQREGRAGDLYAPGRLCAHWLAARGAAVPEDCLAGMHRPRFVEGGETI